MITLEQVLKAYEYANSHPHKYLRGTTNWCAAVAHILNEQTPSAQKQGEPVAVVMPERADEERPEFFSGGDHKDIEHDFDEERGRAIGWNECIDELERLNNIVTPGFKMPPQGWGVKVQAAILPALELSDEQILEAMRPAMMSADGGYVFDTAKQDVIDAGRALLAEVARLNGVKP